MGKVIRKIYKLKYFQKLQLKVRVKGSLMLIEFGGAKQNDPSTRGFIITDDPVLQEALENDSCFNVDYVLDSENVIGEEEKPVEEVIDEPEEIQEEAEEVIEESEEEAEEVQEESEEEEDDEPQKFIPISEVKNVQEAREYMYTKYEDISARMVSNKAQVIEKAAEKNVVFEIFS